MRKKLLEEKKKLAFFARHGISVNKETIWQLVKRFDTVAANARKHCVPQSSESQSSKQLWLTFGQRSDWKQV